jgi:putative transcriptional regulator
MTMRRKPLFERLKQGLEEGIAHTSGELSLRTITVPEAPPEIDGKTVAALRTQAEMSQAVFARVLNVSTKTVQSWEQGVRTPSDASRRLLQLFSLHPDIVCQTAGLPAIILTGVKIEKLRSGKPKLTVQDLTKRKAKTVPTS